MAVLSHKCAAGSRAILCTRHSDPRSPRIDSRHDARFFGDLVCGEWSVKKYHARRDGAYYEDIRTRRCGENVTGAMMLSWTLALFFFARSGMTNCQSFKESLQANPDKAFDLVMRNEV